MQENSRPLLLFLAAMTSVSTSNFGFGEDLPEPLQICLANYESIRSYETEYERFALVTPDIKEYVHVLGREVYQSSVWPDVELYRCSASKVRRRGVQFYDESNYQLVSTKPENGADQNAEIEMSNTFSFDGKIRYSINWKERGGAILTEAVAPPPTADFIKGMGNEFGPLSLCSRNVMDFLRMDWEYEVVDAENHVYRLMNIAQDCDPKKRRVREIYSMMELTLSKEHNFAVKRFREEMRFGDGRVETMSEMFVTEFGEKSGIFIPIDFCISIRGTPEVRVVTDLDKTTLNPELEESDFQIEFPDDAEIYDQRTDTWSGYVPEYVAKRKEAFVRYDPTNLGPKLRRSAYGPFKWVLGACGAAALGFVAWKYFRRKAVAACLLFAISAAGTGCNNAEVSFNPKALTTSANEPSETAVPVLSFLNESLVFSFPASDFLREMLRIPMRNDGDEKIQLLGVASSCGCGQATVDKEFAIPGEEFVVTINTQIPDFRSSRQLDLYLEVMSGQEYRIPMIVTLDAESDWYVVERQTAMTGVVGQALSTALKIHHDPELDLSSISIDGNTGVQGWNVSRISDSEVSLDVQFDPFYEEARLSRRLIIRIPGAVPESQSYGVDIQIESEIFCEPRLLRLTREQTDVPKISIKTRSERFEGLAVVAGMDTAVSFEKSVVDNGACTVALNTGALQIGPNRIDFCCVDESGRELAKCDVLVIVRSDE